MKNIIYIILGTLFGIILTKSQVISWFRIQDMFLMREAHMYLIIGSAVVVGAISIQFLKRTHVRAANRQVLNFDGKVFHKGFIWGGLIFGIGWAITGACPGPIFAQIGAGAYPAWFTLAGALLGTWLYNATKSRLPH